MNLIEKICQQMETDDADTDKQSEILLDVWKKATPEQVKAIDETLLCLCGWSMKTLIEMVQE